MEYRRTMPLLMLLAICVVGVGCQSSPKSLRDLHRTYHEGKFAQAYQQGAWLAQTGKGQAAEDAAYIAGLSAFELRRHDQAQRFLLQSARSSDDKLAGDSLAMLGLIYAKQNRHDLAARTLISASNKLQGHEKAKAHFFAAVELQKLGRFPQAHTHLLMARQQTKDALLRRRVDQQIRVIGFTIQLGAFSSVENARTAAQQIMLRAQPLRLGQPWIARQQYNDGRTLYALRLGRFGSQQSAIEARSRLGRPQALVVPLSQQ